MARTLTEAAITTRNARSKLPLGVHFKSVDPGVHLGYRKTPTGGTWLVRWRSGVGYKQVPLGIADDNLKGDTLDYEAARRAAKAKVETVRKEAKAAAGGAPLTVRSVVEEYVATRDARDSQRKGRDVHSDAHSRLKRYLLSAPVADVALAVLAESDLEKWRAGLPATLKRSTMSRLVNDLKAALNAGYARHRRVLDPMLPETIRQGLKLCHDGERDETEARDNVILTDAEVTRLLRAAGEIDAAQGWEGDLFRLVVVLAATGARFSQAIRLRVGDCQRGQGRLLVPASRKGRGAKGASAPVPVGKDVLDALLPAVTGRPDSARLLERWRHRVVAGDGLRWERTGRGPWQSSELTRPWQAIRERAGILNAIPYSLRHSSIVRGIRGGLPIRLVAALHDTSVRMIERHYSKWVVDGLEEIAARAVVPLVPSETNVIVLREPSGYVSLPHTPQGGGL